MLERSAALSRETVEEISDFAAATDELAQEFIRTFECG